MTVQPTTPVTDISSNHLKKIDVKQSTEKSPIPQEENSLLNNFKSVTTTSATSLTDLQESYTRAGNNLSTVHKQEMAESRYYADLVARNISQTGQTQQILDLMQKTK